ncbi:MAG: hypothetical protein HY553_18755 [Elusimicrobia bacterium]|nr:hypothetical protein [Elusimicrobiota bacterium]
MIAARAACVAASLLLAHGGIGSAEVRERRRYRSPPGVERWLAAPARLLDLPWLPVGRTLDWAQSRDVPKRVMDAFYFNRERTAGWFPAAGARGAGTGVGALVFRDDRREDGDRLELRATSPGGGQYFARGSWRRPARHWRVGSVSIEASKDRDVELYVAPGGGLGMATTPADRRGAGLERVALRVEATRGAGRAAELGVFATGEALREIAAAPGVSPVAPGGPSLGRARLAGGGLRAALDGAAGGARPTSGARLSVEWGAAAEPGGDAALLREAAHGSAFVPLWAPRRVLALRASWERVRPAGRGRVPAYLAPALDAHSGLRSYPTGRFRNRGVASASAEFRWPAWSAWDLFLFVDGGQTVGPGEPPAARAWRASRGGGCRFFAGGREVLLVQWGFGSEGRELVIAVGKAF